ncbi:MULTISPECIES: hypothetical protein [unclassified Pseudoalteromonas]|uniref:hypothetical protein n=1 Tax=unclassified Pseudoalteromonas TaxID=194690 RepID=UPI001109287F|nr:MULTISPECIES: hypothetical protein [unclassified Pseudoalteromonas]TMN78431.1 hypothetical protein CWB64_16215 [Pseudoalteromonas sp. S410]TMN87640.1 hypothetical protein CWB62_17825 [Pseudoalteromonas sp. S408]TMN95331.1 hypothetical protein CWB63_18160 [Pseudoalteromonas sp. S409]TMN96260.1 hypothetical protein CWB61_12375 [Pseudoalteromonas sp. S407]TMO06597.1 hypothetical protein CWB57_17475 [Pseudoalteromonas sp. S186]
MQKVIEFRKTRFMGGVDIAALNVRIQELNQDGWKVISAVPITGFYGQVHGYTLFIEIDEL